MPTHCTEPRLDTRALLLAHDRLPWIPNDEFMRLINLARPFVLAEAVIRPVLMDELRKLMPSASALEVSEAAIAVMVLARAQVWARRKR